MTSEERMLAGISGAGWGSTGTGSGAGVELPKLGKPPKLPQPASPRAESSANIAAAGAGPRLNFPMASPPSSMPVAAATNHPRPQFEARNPRPERKTGTQHPNCRPADRNSDRIVTVSRLTGRNPRCAPRKKGFRGRGALLLIRQIWPRRCRDGKADMGQADLGRQMPGRRYRAGGWAGIP